jgi:hypothetical protein
MMGKRRQIEDEDRPWGRMMMMIVSQGGRTTKICTKTTLLLGRWQIVKRRRPGGVISDQFAAS